MRLILLITGIALALGIILSRTLGRDTKYSVRLIPSIIALILAAGLCIGSLLVNVSPEHIAVLTHNGKVDNEIRNSGWNLVSPGTAVSEYDIRAQNDTIYKGLLNENVVPNDTLLTTTAEGKEIRLGIAVNYNINPAMAVTLHKEAGANFKQRIVQPLSHNLLRRNAVSYSLNEIKGSGWTNFEARLSDDFKREFSKHGLDVSNVMVRLLEPNTTADDLKNLAAEKPLNMANVPTPAPAPHKPIAIHAPKAAVAKAKPAVKMQTPAPVVSTAVPVRHRVHKPMSADPYAKNGLQKPSSVRPSIDSGVSQMAQAAVASAPKATDINNSSLAKSVAQIKKVDTVFNTTVNDGANRIKDSMAQAAAPVERVVPKVPDDVAKTLAAPTTTTVTTVPAGEMPLPAPAALDSTSYEGLKDFVRMHPGDGKRLEALQSVSDNNYYTTKQVLGVNRLLSKPESKLEFSKMAYLHTTDRKNYGLVAAGLDKKSRKQLVKYIVKTMKNQPANNIPETNNASAQAAQIIQRNNDIAQSIQKNTVPADCKIIDDMKLSEMKKRIVQDNTANANSDFIKTTVANNCFTTDQVLRIMQLLKTKQAKLDFAKMAYVRTVDRNQYRRVADNLKPRYRRALDKYIMQVMATAIAEKPESQSLAQVAPAIGDASKSTVEPLLLATVSKFVQQHKEEKARLDALHSLVEHNRISTEQVAVLMQLLSTETSKLQWAEDAYSHTVDKGVYNTIINALSTASQTALQEYMAAHLASK